MNRIMISTVIAAGLAFALTLAGTAGAQTTLTTSTYYGGSAIEGNADIPVVPAPDGSVYTVLNSYSADVPVTASAWQDTAAGFYDLVVARFSGDLKTLMAATYLGGRYNDATNPGVDLALADDGTVYVVTISGSPDWPVTPDAWRTSSAGGLELTVTRLSPGLDEVLAATFLGGSANEDFAKLECLPGGDVLVVCSTTSTNFPVTPNACQSARAGGRDLGFARLDADLTTIVAATYLGSTRDDWPEVMALAADGRPYVTGWSGGVFPTTPGAAQDEDAGLYRAFISRLDTDLTTLEASTIIGGAAWEFGYGLAVDPSGDVWACGHTASLNFPVTDGCYQPAHSGTGDQGGDDEMWIARFDADLTTIEAATYLGAAGWENGFALAPTPGGIVVGGTSSSTDWPLTAGAIDDVHSGGGKYHTSETVLAVLDYDLTTLLSSTYLGGSGADLIGDLAPDGSGGVWLALSTGSTDLAVAPDAFAPTHAGASYDSGGDIFLARLDSDLAPFEASAAPLPTGMPSLRVRGAAPNPFNPSTGIRFELAEARRARVAIHDAAGRLVALLADRSFTGGAHTIVWDGRDGAGRAAPTGVYFARVTSGREDSAVKLLLVK